MRSLKAILLVILIYVVVVTILVIGISALTPGARSRFFGPVVQQCLRGDKLTTYVWYKGEIVGSWHTGVTEADSITYTKQRAAAEAFIQQLKNQKVIQ